MKQLILITAFLVVAATKILAQENAIKIKKSQKPTAELQNENHQFEIVAEQDANINLKLEDKVNAMVTKDQNKVAF